MKIFIDSNIPMYVAGKPHPHRDPSRRFLARVQRGDVEACTSTEVLQEILYRYCSLGHPELATEVYDLFVAICPVIHEVTLADTDRARDLLSAAGGISARDAVHSAVMLNRGITRIATYDRGFDHVPGLSRVRLR